MLAYGSNLPPRRTCNILAFSISVQELLEVEAKNPGLATIFNFSFPEYLFKVFKTICPDFPEDARVLCWTEGVNQAAWVVKVESASFPAVSYYNVVPTFPIGKKTMESVARFTAASQQQSSPSPTGDPHQGPSSWSEGV